MGCDSTGPAGPAVLTGKVRTSTIRIRPTPARDTPSRQHRAPDAPSQRAAVVSIAERISLIVRSISSSDRSAAGLRPRLAAS